MLLFSVGDAALKYAGAFTNPLWAIAVGFAGAAAFNLAYAAIRGDSVMRMVNRTKVFVYSLLFALEMVFLFLAFHYLGFAMEFIFVMITPLLAAKMAQFFLKETMSLRQEAALYLALLTVTVMSWFSYGLSDDLAQISGLGLLCAVGNFVMGAVRITYLKWCCGGESNSVLNFWSLVAAAILPMALQTYYYPSFTIEFVHWLTLLCGVFGFAGGLLYFQSYKNADAVVIAPLMYSQIIWAILIGRFFFQEDITWPMVMGMAGIVAAGALFYWPAKKTVTS